MDFCTTGTFHEDMNVACVIPVVMRANQHGDAPHGDN